MKIRNKATLWILSPIVVLIVACGCSWKEDHSPDTPTLRVSTPTVAPTEFPTATFTRSVSASPKPQVTPRDVSNFRLFATSQRGSAYVEKDTAPVEDILESGLHEARASPVHVAFRGTASGDFVRCEWRGVARTLQQREQAIRFWLELSDSDVLPSPDEAERRFVAEVGGAAFPETAKSGFRIMARGGLSTDQLFLTCYVKYSATEYLLGAGPSTLTAAYDRMGEMRFV